ncbi:polynucleotide adenylyltransferase PcnB, partial [Treponema pallidum]
MLVRYSYDAKGRRLGRALVYTESEHGIPRQSVDAGAIRVVEALVGAGYETYIVGGAVRDL